MHNTTPSPIPTIPFTPQLNVTLEPSVPNKLKFPINARDAREQSGKSSNRLKQLHVDKKLFEATIKELFIYINHASHHGLYSISWTHTITEGIRGAWYHDTKDFKDPFEIMIVLENEISEYFEKLGYTVIWKNNLDERNLTLSWNSGYMAL
jgi:hypothetical protein